MKRNRYGMDKPRRELTEAEKQEIREHDASVCASCGHSYIRHILPTRCADCECRRWAAYLAVAEEPS